MNRFVLSALALLALATPVLAQPHHRHPHRKGAPAGVGNRGSAIVVGNEDIRVNSAGEVIATRPVFVHVQKMEAPKASPAK